MKPLVTPALPRTTDAAPATPRDTPGGSGGFQTVRLGLCEDYPEESHPLAHVAEDMALLQQMGVRYHKIGAAWNDLEPHRGSYNWAHFDRVVDLAAAHGVTLLPYIAYLPRWASTDSGPQFWKHPPKDIADWARFCGALAERYRGRIPSWELWTEPDNHEFFAGSQADYAAMLKAGSSAIRAADPAAKVVFGGIAWNTWWLNCLFKDHGVSPYVDAVNLHNYYETWIDQPIEQITGYVGRVADTLARYGDRQPLWMLEFGYSDHRNGSDVSWACHAYYGYEHTADYQAVHLVKTHALLFATGLLDTVAWYEVRDLPTDRKFIGDVNNCFLGVARPDGTPKPAAAAFRLIERLFRTPYRCIDSETRTTRAGNSQAHLHTFELADGRVVAFAWLQTLVHGSRQQRTWGDAEDNRQEAVELLLPRPIRGSASAFDALGNLRHQAALQPTGATTPLRLLLRGGDVTILEITPAPARTPVPAPVA